MTQTAVALRSCQTQALSPWKLHRQQASEHCLPLHTQTQISSQVAVAVEEQVPGGRRGDSLPAVQPALVKFLDESVPPWPSEVGVRMCF